jgi:hypothetical protein
MLPEIPTKSIRFAIQSDRGTLAKVRRSDALSSERVDALSAMKKKKLILGVLAGITGLLVIPFAVIAMSLDRIVKSGVETVGPKVTRTTFTVEDVKISPFDGTGSITGLLIGNPEGYTSNFAVKMDRAFIQIRPSSMWSEKLIIDSILVDAPEIAFEGGQRENNLGAILQNIKAYTGERDQDRSNRKLQVNHFRLSGAKVHLKLSMFGNRIITLAAPDIELRDMGTGPEGVTSAELTELVVKRISSAVGTMITSSLAEIGRAQADPSAN